MEAWAREFLDVWQANRDRIADTMLQAIADNPHLPVKYSRQDVMQIFDGVRAMIEEALVGQSTELWEMYFDTVLPAMFAGGQPVGALAGQVVINSMLLQSVLIPAMSAENADKAATFFRNFYCKICMDSVKIGILQGGQP